MYSYKWKIISAWIAAVSFILLVIQKLTSFTVLPKFNAHQHFNILAWFTIFGLFGMMFSHEKHEDERVKQIRAKSVMYVFMLMFGATLAFGLTLSLATATEVEPVTITVEDMVEFSRILMYYPACAVIMYHIIFNMGLYYDDEWDYEDNTNVIDNIKNHWPRILLRIAVSLVVIWLIFKFIV